MDLQDPILPLEGRIDRKKTVLSWEVFVLPQKSGALCVNWQSWPMDEGESVLKFCGQLSFPNFSKI